MSLFKGVDCDFTRFSDPESRFLLCDIDNHQTDVLADLKLAAELDCELAAIALRTGRREGAFDSKGHLPPIWNDTDLMQRGLPYSQWTTSIVSLPNRVSPVDDSVLLSSSITYVSTSLELRYIV